MFKLQINLGNDLMQEPEDVAEALEKVIEELLDSSEDNPSGSIKDDNGNTVGKWSLKYD